jgi:preprotein translocase subunit SecB
MHIVVEAIYLESLDFRLFPEYAQNRSYGLHVTSQSFFDDFETPKTLKQVLEFDVTHEVVNPAFELKFVMVAQYHSEGEGEPTLKEFAKVNGPAYIVPYARELIANLTSRAILIPTLVIPPINMVALLKESRAEENDQQLEFKENPEELQ